jgi:hypothetical protein
MERMAMASGRKLADVPREEMEAFWDQAKGSEKASAQASRARKAGGRR